jgi:hypothetical protein
MAGSHLINGSIPEVGLWPTNNEAGGQNIRRSGGYLPPLNRPPCVSIFLSDKRHCGHL